MVLIERMSQFQFKFDVTSSSQARTISAPPQEEQRNKESLVSSNEKSRPFQLIDDLSTRLRKRRQERLDYVTVDLPADSLLAPLLQVQSTVTAGVDSTFDKILHDIDHQKTDIIPGVYEGGLQVWECSLDLCYYLARHFDEIFANNATSVLELGCGHGLPACLVLREGLERKRNISVMFTDYNDFVLQGVTLSNIVLNTQGMLSTKNELDTTIVDKVILGAGDWLDMSNQLRSGSLREECSSLPSNGQFDVILAAESTYTAQTARDTAALLALHLKPESGIGLVACKRYYFGVGGGSDAFREAAASLPNSNEYRLSVETLQTCDSGIGNIRDLLKLKMEKCS